jgi:hypothetical protein
MELKDYWDHRADLDTILPTLAQLTSEGVVDRADAWPDLRSEVLTRLEYNGANKSHIDDLIKPLDEAVSRSGEFTSVVTEMTSEYAADLERRAALEQQAEEQRTAASQQVTSQQATSPDPQADPAFTAGLPDLEELATRIVTDLGPSIAQLVASDPELAKISDKELVQWIAEDVRATVDEIGEYGWERLG